MTAEAHVSRVIARLMERKAAIIVMFPFLPEPCFGFGRTLFAPTVSLATVLICARALRIQKGAWSGDSVLQKRPLLAITFLNRYSLEYYY